MRKRNINSPNYGQMLDNAEVFYYFFNDLCNIHMSQLEITGLPDSCRVWSFKRALINTGTAAIFFCPATDEWYSTKYIAKDRSWIYGEPINIEGVGYKKALIPVDQSKYVIFWDNDMHESPLPTINTFAYLMWSIFMTYRNNMMQQNTPYIVAAPQEVQETINYIMTSIIAKDRSIEISPEMGKSINDIIKVLDLKVDYKGEQLLSDLNKWKNMALRSLGCMTPSEKRERENVTESTSNQMQSLTTLAGRYNNIKHGLDQLKKLDPIFSNAEVHVATIDPSEMQFTPTEITKLEGVTK